MSSDGMKNVVLDTSDSQILLDQRIKTRDGWVAEVNFICKDICEKAHSVNDNVTGMKFQTKKDINELHVKFGHPSEAIKRATGNIIIPS